MGKIIGIDLGTTNSAFAVMQAGDATIITNNEGNRTTPSVVAIKVSKDGKEERLVGQIANRQRVTNPENTIFGVKRLIGRKPSDKEVPTGQKLMRNPVIPSGSTVQVKMGGSNYRQVEVSAKILSKIKLDAEA